MTGIFESCRENAKAGTSVLMPRLEDVHKESVKKYGEEPLTEKGEQRYRRVLGQLAWAALSRADVSFPRSFVSRFQAKPNPAAEHFMRVFQYARNSVPACRRAKGVVSFRDAASWGVDSVSGAILIYKGCCIKFFS